MSDNMIEIADLTRFYGQTRVLDRINLTVKRGEVMGFLGPNGAGKTTTMRILAGLLAPTEGSVTVAGIDALEHPEAARARIGFLPEDPPIYDEMTVREYLAYLAGLRGVPGRERGAAVDKAMLRCGLTEVSERLLRNLSKGFRQRAAIAQAIVHGPDVVILDEPTVGLDPLQIREIRKLIRQLGGTHSVLLSTHILPEVRMTCDRVALIHKGRIVLEDTLEALDHRSRREGRLLVRWNNPPAEAELAALPGVARVERDDTHWVITPAPETDPIPPLLARSVAQGWDLRELSPASQDLEEIFVQLTQQEAAEDAAREAA
ncbi:MAG: ABC transporter ATP-binding protein [Magnetococcales bacterium]|nr:ABC transporter ATP-binding protein [Magnetococcales bacterium]